MEDAGHFIIVCESCLENNLTSILWEHQKIPMDPFHAPSQNRMKLSHNGNDHPITA